MFYTFFILKNSFQISLKMEFSASAAPPGFSIKSLAFRCATLMVKPKKRQLAALPANKNGAPSGLSGSVNSKTKVDLLGEDSWVIVKKQRVTILVPPLPVAKESQMPNPGLSQPQAIPQETNTKRWQVSSEACPLRDSVVEREKIWVLMQ
ncbi:unnamed protein product, partial [Vitis vinifera]